MVNSVHYSKFINSLRHAPQESIRRHNCEISGSPSTVLWGRGRSHRVEQSSATGDPIFEMYIKLNVEQLGHTKREMLNIYN